MNSRTRPRVTKVPRVVRNGEENSGEAKLGVRPWHTLFAQKKHTMKDTKCPQPETYKGCAKTDVKRTTQ